MTLSPNGEFCLGGGNSKNICLYDMKHKVLLKRLAVTQNRSLDGVLLKLNSKNIKEDGVMQHELDEMDSDLEEDAWATAKDTDLPGAKTPKNLLQRNTRLAVRIKCIKFSPDGTQFAAATTEGLVLYSNKQNSEAFFNPFMIDEQVTLDNIIAKVKDMVEDAKKDSEDGEAPKVDDGAKEEKAADVDAKPDPTDSHDVAAGLGADDE